MMKIISVVTDNFKTNDVKKFKLDVEVPCPSTNSPKDFYCNYISIVNKVLKLLIIKKNTLKK